MSNRRFNPFGDEPRDRNNMILWLIKRLNSLSSNTMDGEIISKIEEMLDELEELDKFLKEHAESSESIYSDEFLDRIWPLWENYRKLSGEDFAWGIWRTEEKRILSHGYSSQHKRTVVRKKSATAVNYYRDIPKKTTWECMPITQKGNTFYIVNAKVAELNALCSVPSFEKTLPTIESGLRVLYREREEKQWQRNPNPERIAAIETFIGDPTNIVANTPLVYAPESKFISYDKMKNGLLKSVTIDFSFLLNTGGEYCDHEGMQDLRPLWLIDGQHRIRGISQNPISTELDIAFVFFPEQLGVNAAAKIFAEVNTLARDLSDLHKMFMRHRFQLQSVDYDKDFRPYEEGRPEQKNSRMNSLSYECAAFLTSERSSPLRELIKILDENVEGNHIIDAKMFVKNSRHWFGDNAPFSQEKKLDKEEIFAEILNYFKALETVVNHYIHKGPELWKDGKQRWLRSPPKIGKNTLQNTRCFRAILRLFPDVVIMCSGEKRPISQTVFEKTLSPLAWIDWNNDDLHSAYAKKTGEQWWKCLLVWMQNAIKNGESYSMEEVMSSKIKSKPGKGILAPPEKPVVELEEGSPSWPSPDKPMILKAEMPINSMPTSIWTVRDANEAVRNDKGRKKFKAGIDSISRFEIKYRLWMDSRQNNGKEMEIRVDWMNANGEVGGSITLPNPN